MHNAHLFQRLGTMVLSQTGDVVAGSMGHWTFTFTVGSYGIDSGEQIKLAFPLVTDWEEPQFENPTESGYTTVTTAGAAKLRVSWQPRGHVRPWRPCIVIDIYDDSLNPGNIVTIELGDRSAGSPGIRAQTYQESRHEFRTLVDPTNACDPGPIPTSPSVAVVADEAMSLVCLAPSQATVNEPMTVLVKGEDRWRNPTRAPADVTLDWEGDGDATMRADSLLFRATNGQPTRRQAVTTT